jgi:hypothetical protein
MFPLPRALRIVSHGPKDRPDMDSPRKSLNAFLTWAETAPLLNIALDHGALPVRTHCPLCHQGRFYVCQDSLCGGAWFSCSDCGRAGDLIELAAAIWSMNPSTAITELARRGASLAPELLDSERIADYVRDFPTYRQRLMVLWDQARVWLPHYCRVSCN